MGFLQPVFLITDPYLNVFRRLPLQIGGFDLSVLPALFLLNFAQGGIAALGQEMPARGARKITGDIWERSAAFASRRRDSFLPTLRDGFRSVRKFAADRV
mmetsp:Transcript_1875/g.5483  ORF Transcript_1875/g.5483 Transcript_1875/m.5483 type:complete len:100 (-) Transcript_1875:476-775(-)